MNRLKDDVVRVSGIFLAFSGFVGVLLQIFTTPERLRNLALITLSAAICLLGLWLIVYRTWRRHKMLKALPQISELEQFCIGYRLDQATSEEIDWIAQLEADVYSAEDAVPKHVLKEWYKSNPNGFFIIRMVNGQKVGHIDLLPLRPATFQTFLEGNILERDIRGDSLYLPTERDLIKEIYVESIIILPPKDISNVPAIMCILSNFVSLIEKICDPLKLENVYAIAATKAGEEFMKRLGFDIIKRGRTRTDHHDLFFAGFANLAKNIAAICGDKLKENDLVERIIR